MIASITIYPTRFSADGPVHAAGDDLPTKVLRFGVTETGGGLALPGGGLALHLNAEQFDELCELCAHAADDIRAHVGAAS